MGESQCLEWTGAIGTSGAGMVRRQPVVPSTRHSARGNGDGLPMLPTSAAAGGVHDGIRLHEALAGLHAQPERQAEVTLAPSRRSHPTEDT